MKLQNLPAGLLVFTGGGCGAASRWLLGLSGLENHLLTLGINLLGAFLLGFLLTFLPRLGSENDARCGGLLRGLRLGVGTGFMGGFTTYSTFSLQSFQLLRTGNELAFLGYWLGSLILGFVVCLAGMLCAEKIRFHVKQQPFQGGKA